MKQIFHRKLMSPVSSSVLCLIRTSITPTPVAFSVFYYKEQPVSVYGDNV
jgi:hypothetical protein